MKFWVSGSLCLSHSVDVICIGIGILHVSQHSLNTELHYSPFQLNMAFVHLIVIIQSCNWQKNNHLPPQNSDFWAFLNNWYVDVLVNEKNFWNSRLKAENLQIFWDQWRVRTIFGNRMLFNLFLELEFKLEKNVGI